MNHFLTAIAAGAASLLVLGCASARPIAPIDMSTAGYRDAALSDQELKSAGIAVLPVTASRPGDRLTAEGSGYKLAQAIQRKAICTVVLDPAAVNERFEARGITARFETMVSELPKTGELDRDTLDAMAESTGCRYFLQAQYESGQSYHVAQVDNRPHASRALTSRIRAQLWDAATGEVVWEGVGGGAALTNPPHGGTSAQTVEIAVSGLADMVARDPSEVPVAREVGELHHREHMEMAEVNGENAQRADAVFTGIEIVLIGLEIASTIADIAD